MSLKLNLFNIDKGILLWSFVQNTALTPSSKSKGLGERKKKILSKNKLNNAKPNIWMNQDKWQHWYDHLGWLTIKNQ